MPTEQPARKPRRRLYAGLATAGVAGIAAAAVALTVPSANASTLFSENFESGAPSGWSKSGGDWSVADDGSKVYRQAKASSEAARVLAGDAAWTDYAVSARVKATEVGPGGFAGVAARASGPTTLYRLVLTASGTAELHGVKGSAVTVLGSVPVAAPTGTFHTLRIQASGTTVTGWADGSPVGSGTGSVSARGRLGLVTSMASASFDDVLATTASSGAVPAPGTTTAPITAAPAPTTASPAPSKTASPAPSASRTASAAPTQSSGTSPNAPWPTASGTKPVAASVTVSGTLDGGMARYYGTGDLGGSGQDEGQDPIFDLADGATLKNVIIGSPAADGVHCAGTCTLINVWWEDVGEDAATFRGGATAVFLVDGGGARKAGDKVFQHNGGGTLTIKNFQVTDFGKLYRSCGNCSTQYKRTVVIENVRATAPGDLLAGVNANYGDAATFRNVTIAGDTSMDVCTRFTGNSTGGEPTQTGSGADGTTCKYTPSDVTFT
ncbi:pectate lyase [Catenuloplanes atrovinosus]|uniref:pectate lyase n=1 Tax=Catenuloplanes atrovinosus TaxID=137266 RepID=A0AAE3YJJ6_9ACTN|nr:pectate lyase [Catenuloplanes atrovinosus]MDR7273519.1 hypothetical protein [Catenuloplanes atrovinosus]